MTGADSANLARIADALERLVELAVRYCNDDTTLLDRLVCAEEENRRRLDDHEARIRLLGETFG